MVHTLLEPDFFHSVLKQRMLFSARVDGGREPGFQALGNSVPHPRLSTRAIQTHLLFTPNQPAFLAVKSSEDLESPWKRLPACCQVGSREEVMRDRELSYSCGVRWPHCLPEESALPLQTRNLGQISPSEKINRERPWKEMKASCWTLLPPSGIFLFSPSSERQLDSQENVNVLEANKRTAWKKFPLSRTPNVPPGLCVHGLPQIFIS